MQNFTIVSVSKSRRAYHKVSDLPAGQAFARGYHDIDDMANGNCQFSIYFKLPKSERSVGDLTLSDATAESVRAAMREGRIGFNVNKGCCSVIPANECVWPLTLKIEVEIQE